mmetsp:Transcript_2569/g.2781  ORF Transcript_2569/g.2781 Transcript_2569/m.2781 type:complete len:133 (-) Transcript_2569:502-900(-)
MQTVTFSPWLTHARSNSTVRFEENRNRGGGVGKDTRPAETRVWKIRGNKRRTVRKNGFLVQQPNKRRHSKLSHTVGSTPPPPFHHSGRQKDFSNTLGAGRFLSLTLVSVKQPLPSQNGMTQQSSSRCCNRFP